MPLFLKDLPCRNPANFTRLHSTGAVRPTYTATCNADTKEIINDPIPLIVHHLSRLPIKESCKQLPSLAEMI